MDLSARRPRRLCRAVRPARHSRRRVRSRPARDLSGNVAGGRSTRDHRGMLGDSRQVARQRDVLERANGRPPPGGPGTERARCTLIAYYERLELGRTLADAARPVPLAHKYCELLRPRRGGLRRLAGVIRAASSARRQRATGGWAESVVDLQRFIEDFGGDEAGVIAHLRRYGQIAADR